jgi:hypothetical protein
MKKKSGKLYQEKIEKHSGFYRSWHGVIPALRKGYYWVSDRQLEGDAPKRFVHVYEYGEGRKDQPKKWPGHLAKVGHKWYPCESITEYLLNQIGKVLGLNMAACQLRLAGSQIRFLSKYFLHPGEILVHGAEIYAGYFEDEEFVHQIEAENMAKEFFTFQVAEEAINHMFPEQAEELMWQLVQMLVFDALTGNNDRHFYNWGVITHIEKEDFVPHFSPIFDTARGLFWNRPESALKKIERHPNMLTKYIEKAQPKFGWEGEEDTNHFRLVELILQHEPRFRPNCLALLEADKLGAIFELLSRDFIRLLSERRMKLVRECIHQRWKRLQSIARPYL